jgi:hypothetical protein
VEMRPEPVTESQEVWRRVQRFTRRTDLGKIPAGGAITGKLAFSLARTRSWQSVAATWRCSHAPERAIVERAINGVRALVQSPR